MITCELKRSHITMTVQPRRIVFLAVGAVFLAPGCDGKGRVDPNVSGLASAAVRADIEAVRRYVERGADVNACEPKHGGTALTAAVCGGSIEIVRYLLDHGADPRKGWALIPAVRRRRIDLAGTLLAHGADPNTPRAGGVPSSLTIAAENGDVAMLRVLIEHGVDLRAEGVPNPILAAVRGGHRDAVELLLAKGAANVNTKGPDGRRPLSIAESLGQRDIASVLRKHGAVK